MVTLGVLLMAVVAFWLAAAVIGAVFKLAFAVVGGLLGLAGALVGGVVALVTAPLLVLAAMPVLLPVLLVAGLGWLIARAARGSAGPSAAASPR